MKGRTEAIFAAAAIVAALAGAAAARRVRFSCEYTAVCPCVVSTNQSPPGENGAYHDVGMTMRNRLAAYGGRDFRETAAVSAPCDCDTSAFRAAVAGAEISVRSSYWRAVEFDVVATSADRAAATAAATAYASAMKESFDSEFAARSGKAVAHLRAMRRSAERRLEQLKAAGDGDASAQEIAEAEREVAALTESEDRATAESAKFKDEFTIAPVVVHPPKRRLAWK